MLKEQEYTIVLLSNVQLQTVRLFEALKLLNEMIEDVVADIA